jgi:hypothetical protein
MKKLTVIFLLIFALAIFTSCEKKEKTKTQTEISELKEMHHYIHPMWHDAYPAKDTKQLKALYPELEQQFDKLQNAPFPEEWEDKKMHWQEGVVQMESTLAEYKSAMDRDDQENLLLAARTLHDNFENLVMIINPPIPELDDFHKTLYHVYHDYLPNEDWENLKAAIPEFEKKVQALQQTKLPRWMAGKEDTFNSACDQLEGAVQKLSALKESDDAEAKAAAVEEVHEAYVKLQGSME